MYFDMGAFYKVCKPFSFPGNFLRPLFSFRLLVTSCILSCLEVRPQVRPTDGTYLSWFASGDKEKDKLKEVLGWVDGFVKVTNLPTIKQHV